MPSSRPAWLPALLITDGEWEKVLAQLYKVFEGDFKNSAAEFRGIPVVVDSRVLEAPYEEGFWHLITRVEKGTGERLPDFPRAQRLSWCKPLLTHSAEPEVLVWDYEEGNRRIRTYIWLADFDYVIVLQKRNYKGRQIADLVTAYSVDGEGTRRQLRRKYKKRV